MVWAHGEQEWRGFLEELHQQARAFSFYYESQVQLHVSKDHSIQEQLIQADSFRGVSYRINQEFSNQKIYPDIMLKEKLRQFHLDTMKDNKTALILANQYQ